MLNRRSTLQAGLGLAALFSGLSPAYAADLLRGRITQGALIRGKTLPEAKIRLDGKQIRPSAAGNFAFGFAYDRKDAAVLRIELPDGEPIEQTLKPTIREYRVQKINRDNALIGAARSRDTEEDWFAEEFAWPVKGPLTGVFGSQRILNGVPKRPHFGLDIAAPEGKPLSAPINAIVSMAEPDLYFTGGTVILDHGHGVSSSYLHMSRIDVKVGDRLKKGDVFGAVGKTGRATGPHLCWRLNWFQERLDPELVLPAA
jgi:murein DD-endopeptidase MepM/ murein hydrolase activator NlpD